MTHVLDTVRKLCQQSLYIEANDILLKEVHPRVQQTHGSGSYQEAELYFYHGYCLHTHNQQCTDLLLRKLCHDPIVRDTLLPNHEGEESDEAFDNVPGQEDPESSSEDEDCSAIVWEYLEFARVYFLDLLSSDDTEKFPSEQIRCTKIYLSVIHYILGLLTLEKGEKASVAALDEFRDAQALTEQVFEKSHPYFISLTYNIGKSLALYLNTISEAVKMLNTTLELLEQKGRQLYTQESREKEEAVYLPLRGLHFYTDVTASDIQAVLQDVEVLAENPELVELLSEDTPKPVERKSEAQYNLGVLGGNRKAKGNTTTTTTTITINPTKPKKETKPSQKVARQTKTTKRKQDDQKGRESKRKRTSK